jgi:putative membrane protein
MTKWYFFTYKLENSQLHIRSGVFKKKDMYLDKNRVQTIRKHTSFYFRLFHVTSIFIETAGGDKEPEVSIHAITEDEARIIMDDLHKKEHRELEENNSKEAVSSEFSFTNKELWLAAVTSGRIGIVFGALLFLYQQLDQFIPKSLEKKLGSFITHFSSELLVVMVAMFFLSWILSIFVYLIQYAHFHTKMVDNRIQITKGVFEKEEFYVKPHRIQAIIMKEGLIWKLFGYCSLSVEVIGTVNEEKAEQKMIFPLIKKSKLVKMFPIFFPNYQHTENLLGVSKEAQGFYCREWIKVAGFLSVVTGGISWYFHLLWVVILIPLFILLGIWLGRRHAKYAKYNVNHQQVVLSFLSFLSIETVFILQHNIQSIGYSQNWFQKRKKVSSIGVNIASKDSGNTFALNHLDKESRERILDWFHSRTNRKKAI